MNIIISTHTLTWSVTPRGQNTASKHCHFNSHAHVERDLEHVSNSDYDIVISTHTLTWSVTRDLKSLGVKSLHFNSHAHVERDSGQ